MNTLLVGFSKPKTFKIFSWLIRKVDRTEFSHVFIRWSSAYLERDIVYQASKLAVNFEEGKNFDAYEDTMAIFEFELTEATHKKIVQFAMDNSNKPYSMKQIVGIALVKLAAVFGKKITNPFKDGRTAYVCCELVAQILVDECGFKIEEDLDTLTPGELYKVITNLMSTKQS